MRSEAPTLPVGYRLIALDEVGSTNDEAIRLASRGAPDGTLVWAGSQTAGRGRRDRRWISPPGNLYCSLLLRPACEPFEAAQISFVTALAVCEAVEAFLPAAAVRCKWPNDVLVRDRKVAGILLESATARGGALDWLVLGVGVNVANHPDFADAPAATSLRSEGAVTPEVRGVLETFAVRFDVWRKAWERAGFAGVRAAWLDRAAGLRESVRVSFEREQIDGRFSDVTEAGELVLTLPGGMRRVVSAGDVRLIRIA